MHTKLFNTLTEPLGHAGIIYIKNVLKLILSQFITFLKSLISNELLVLYLISVNWLFSDNYMNHGQNPWYSIKQHNVFEAWRLDYLTNSVGLIRKVALQY